MTCEPTRRRRFRWAFSLRTLFVVVTVLACCLGYVVWQWRIFQERKAFLAIMHENEGYAAVQFTPLEFDPLDPDNPLSYSVPWLRAIFGDEAIFDLQLPFGASPEEIKRAKSLFPEASISVSNIPKGSGFF